MKLCELLSELRDNVLRDSSDLIAGDADTLWSDETLLRYIKQGERKFARQVMCLRDATTALVTQVKLKTGVANYPLHPSVFGVVSARYNADNFDLMRSGHGIINQTPPPEFLYFDPTVAYTVSPGRPVAFYTDETLVYAQSSRVTLSVYPAPSATENGNIVHLRVLRVPLMAYDVDHLDACTEIPEDYELDPLQWAAHLATKNHDGDAGSSVRSDKYKQAYNEAVHEALRETKRRMFAGEGFRFGAGGFSYTR